MSLLTTIARRIDQLISFGASLGRVLGPVLDLLIRLWLAQGFLLTDVMQHMLPSNWLPVVEHGSMLERIATTGVGIFIQTICPLLLATGLLTRVAAAALLVQVLALHLPGHTQTAPYAAALLGGCNTGPGPFSLEDAFRFGIEASALPFARAISRGLASLTGRFGPVYNLLLRLWISTALATLALGSDRFLGSDLPAGMGMQWLPRMSGMGAGLPPWLLLVFAAALALGLWTRLAALLFIALLPATLPVFFRGVQPDWLVLLNLPLLGLPLLFGAGAISLDHSLANWLRRRFPRFEALPAAAVARLPRVVVVGGGFGGVAAVRALRHASCRVTLVDQHNYHLFQPLLYQVATAGLSPGDIAVPLREIFRNQANVRVLLGQVTAIDAGSRRVMLDRGHLDYDFLVLATGARHSYFDRDDWAPFAPGLKGIEDALAIRRRLLLAFEEAEGSADEDARRAWLTFVIVGAGPTGVELAGALAELARNGLTREFRTIDPATARILLVQSADRVLPSFPPPLSAAAVRSLAALGVEVRTNCKVRVIDAEGVAVGAERVAARTVLWAAGVAASPAAAWIGAEADRAGRVQVDPELRVPGRPEIFVIGDTAICDAWGGDPVPGLAPAAKQGGAYAGKAIRAALAGRAAPPPFQYRHYGSLATIGRQAAVANFGWLWVSGAPAWWLWGAAHLAFLVSARNRLGVLVTWLWAYLTFRRGTRLITGSGA